MNMFQLGYLKPSDRVMINDTIVKSTGTFNLYAESKKMHWVHPELQSSDFVEYLIQRGLMVSTEGVDINQSNTFIITHQSPNIFSLELIFGQYPVLLKHLNPVEIGRVGSWYNVYPHYGRMSELFDLLQACEIPSRELLVELDTVLNDIKERESTNA